MECTLRNLKARKAEKGRDNAFFLGKFFGACKPTTLIILNSKTEIPPLPYVSY